MPCPGIKNGLPFDKCATLNTRIDKAPLENTVVAEYEHVGGTRLALSVAVSFQVEFHSGDFDLAGVISGAQMAMGRMYMPARKFPVISHASGVRNQ